MSAPAGVTALLGAVCVAGLAVGAGYGVHSLVGDRENPDPVPSPTDTVGPSAALCDPMALAAVDEFDEYESPIYDFELLQSGEPIDGLEPLDFVHAEAERLIAEYEHTAELYEQAGPYAPDAAAQANLVEIAGLTREEGNILSDLALEAPSVDEYVNGVAALLVDPTFAATIERSDTLGSWLSDFLVDECGVDYRSSATAAAEDAKRDAGVVGEAIVAYFADWADGSDLPAITEDGGEYLLNGDPIADVTPGTSVTNQYVVGPDDWCVQVTGSGPPAMTYRYTASGGLERDYCPSD
jgi:hypothetical protein